MTDIFIVPRLVLLREIIQERKPLAERAARRVDRLQHPAPRRAGALGSLLKKHGGNVVVD